MAATEWQKCLTAGTAFNSLGRRSPFRIESVDEDALRVSRLTGKHREKPFTLKYELLDALYEDAVENGPPERDWNAEANRIWAPWGYRDTSNEAQYWAIVFARLLYEQEATDPGGTTPEVLAIEGRLSHVLTTRYERDKKLRQRCLKLYGYRCSVCDFDFEERFGRIGKEVIQVHHLHPVAVGGPRKTSAKDMRPVCANCHVMLHRSWPQPFSIEELQRKLQR